MKHLIKFIIFGALTFFGQAIQSQTIDTITDTRDGQKYPIVKIGNQFWFGTNLNYLVKDSWCYQNKEENCTSHGRLYTWFTAVKACPSGWHLPSKDEWMTLINYLGGYSGSAKIGTQLKSTTGWYGNNIEPATNSTEFSALPGGSVRKGNQYGDGGQKAYFWTSTGSSAYDAFSIKLSSSNSGILIGPAQNKKDGNSIRCIKD